MTDTQKNKVRREVKANLDSLIKQASEFIKKAKEAKKELKAGPISMSALYKIPCSEELGVSLIDFSDFIKRVENDL